MKIDICVVYDRIRNSHKICFLFQNNHRIWFIHQMVQVVSTFIFVYLFFQEYYKQNYCTVVQKKTKLFLSKQINTYIINQVIKQFYLIRLPFNSILHSGGCIQKLNYGHRVQRGVRNMMSVQLLYNLSYALYFPHNNFIKNTK